ncbi:GNAT family N-acetyltransferase [Klebsiella pneumoniae]|uniref:GNAT family N-acetyltransferase n=1 Tax=Klebsiella pneumoniae TaxID=573 RepID=UPI0015E901B1|nr:GNAT family N-acetyltransferase [Klebsiella pneumoniae]QLS82907.1 GNAT family N-acetyltransferase [Klebsiella pneumoniae]HBR1356701.1 GNAT family N-acetyltransferase [Klebsiella quasipneumoniae subsp. quasipneumoniae]HBS7612360.1 GNAT family N-acetyltransferase [Klebsiella pneumoniae]
MVRNLSIAPLVRAACASEIEPLAKIWYDGWQDAHAKILPAELARYRTLQSFEQRLFAALSSVRVAGEINAPIGFCMVRGDELDQLYVSAHGRGTGVGAALLADGEARMSESGVATAWLACAIGNERAAAFYQKQGWSRTGTMLHQLDTQDGPFPLTVWRFEKDLRSALPA